MSSFQRTFSAPTLVTAPELAYGRPDVFHMGHHDYPREDGEYREYKFLGRMPIAAHADLASAKLAAKEKYGPRASAFWTPRWWVAFVIE